MVTCPKCGSQNARHDSNSPAPEKLFCHNCWYGSAVTWDPLDQFRPPDQQRACPICGSRSEVLPDDGSTIGGLCKNCARKVKASKIVPRSYRVEITILIISVMVVIVGLYLQNT